MYVQLITLKIEPTYFEDGSVYHNALENLSKGMGMVEVAAAIRSDYEEYIRNLKVPFTEEVRVDYNGRMLKVQAMVQAYHAHYGDEYGTGGDRRLLEAESEFKIQLDDDVWIVGKKDKRILCGGEVQLVEHKSAGAIGNSYINKLPRDQQTLTYLWADKQEHGKNGAKAVIYDVTKKPSIRQKKDETRGEYLERVKDGYTNKPESHFYRETLRYNKKQLDRFEKELRIVSSHMKACIDDHKSNVYHGWPSACDDFGGCSFKQICNKRSLNGPHMEHFYKRDRRHQELDIERKDDEGGT